MVTPSESPDRIRQQQSALTRSWVAAGIVAGAAGALSVAIVFLGVDLLAGRPLWVPTALGNAIFRGEIIESRAPAEAVMVGGYTLFHGTVFVAFGLLASLRLDSSRDSWQNRPVLFTTALFVVLEGLSLLVGATLTPALIGALGIAWISIANFVAAVGMWYVLLGREAIR